MKKVIFTCSVLLVILFSTKVSYAGGCLWEYANYIGFWSGDTLYNNGDTINIVDNIIIIGESNCPPGCLRSINVTRNGSPFANNIPFTITDTGTYIITKVLNLGASCNYETYIDTVNVWYKPVTSIIEINNQNIFQLYPSISSGLFQLKTKEQLKKILITDGVGRIVFSSFVPVSEINLCNVAEGIYFYAIEDEKERVWRGKIVKE